jgi:hypothetical protein
LQYAHTYADPNGNTYSDSTTPDTHTHANSDSTTTHTYANCNTYADSNGDCYRNTNSHTTGYSLSTAPDDRPHQGSQYAVQFHGTGKPY